MLGKRKESLDDQQQQYQQYQQQQQQQQQYQQQYQQYQQQQYPYAYQQYQYPAQAPASAAAPSPAAAAAPPNAAAAAYSAYPAAPQQYASAPAAYYPPAPYYAAPPPPPQQPVFPAPSASNPPTFPPFVVTKRNPTIQEEAAVQLDRILRKRSGGGLRSLSLEGCIGNTRAIFALICQTYKNIDVINQVISQANIPYGYTVHPVYLQVLVYDAALGQGLKGKTPEEQLVMGHVVQLKNTLAQVRSAGATTVPGGDTNGAPAQNAAAPYAEKQYVRFVRINTLAKSTEECVKQLIDEGYEKVEIVTPEDSGKKIFCLDTIVPDLLVFPPNLNVRNHPLFHAGVFLFQDKASSFPVMALKAQPGWHIIDACAAPGNKTVHIAAVINNEGRIFAFDSDHNRSKILDKTISKAGATCAVASHQDFLHVNPRDPKYAQVQAILLDPSCSGSGTIFYADTNRSLVQYATTQMALLNHALSFPSVHTVVYSTCSINPEENEDVVRSALEKKGEFWKLSKAVPQWPRRGKPLLEGSEKLLRTSPEEDHTLGFFVARFKRIKSAAEHGEYAAPSLAAAPAVVNGGAAAVATTTDDSQHYTTSASSDAASAAAAQPVAPATTEAQPEADSSDGPSEQGESSEAPPAKIRRVENEHDDGVNAADDATANS